MLEIRTLGGVSLRINGKQIHEMGSHKAEALLVYLAVEPGLHNRSVLASLLWPESAQTQSSTSLRVALAILRKHLGEYLDISRETVRVKPGLPVYLDLSDLEEKLSDGHIQDALEIYRGDFLQGFQLHDSAEFEDWVRWEQERVRRTFLKALHASADTAMEAANFTDGISILHRLLELDPLDEIAHHKMIRMLALDGQRGSALAQYERCRAILEDELGASPSIELQGLYKKILSGEKIPLPQPIVPGNNLPAAQTSFVGREAELNQIESLIHDSACRLINLVGPGGSGKTRLALQAAEKFLRSFTDGACFIPLEACASTSYLVPTIAKALQFDIDAIATDFDPKTQLLDYLQDKSMLLLMDGFEHLVEGASLISEVLERAPKLKILASSRQRLGLHGEWVVFLEGLPIHPNGKSATPCTSDAIQLFCERARQTKIDFQLTEMDLRAVRRICQLVEGMPLGIELAAAWISLLSPVEIAAEMEKGLDFLVGSERDIPDKHRSLRAVFDSTWSLMAADQKKFFSQLSMFRGGFDRQAVEQVCGATLAQISELHNQSLLYKTSSGYFNMHSLLRQFAFEKLNQSEHERNELYDRFSQYYIHWLKERELDFMGVRMLQARDEIQQAIDNIREAIHWACQHWTEERFRKALISLLYYYACDGWHEGADAFRDIARLRIETLLARGVADPQNDSVVLCARTHQAVFYTELGLIDESESISRECLDGLVELGLKEELSECLDNLGVNASFRGEYELAREYLEKAVLLGRECNHHIWITYLLWLGHTYFLLGEYEHGMLTLQKSQELFERLGTSWGIAFALSKMGLAADGMGEHADAVQYHNDALAIFRRLNNPAGVGFALSRTCMSAYFLGDYQKALKFGLEGYQTFEKINHRWGMCTTLCRLGFAYLGLGEIDKACQQFTAALEQSRQEQMLPVSLYALAGVASLLARQGESQAALELFHYVRQHPRTPSAYLQQAVRWVEGMEQASKKVNVERLSEMDIRDVIEWTQSNLERRNSPQWRWELMRFKK